MTSLHPGKTIALCVEVRGPEVLCASTTTTGCSSRACEVQHHLMILPFCVCVCVGVELLLCVFELSVHYLPMVRSFIRLNSRDPVTSSRKTDLCRLPPVVSLFLFCNYNNSLPYPTPDWAEIRFNRSFSWGHNVLDRK